jgi:SPP1 gp7 family putative phage head morphogenesis protein
VTTTLERVKARRRQMARRRRLPEQRHPNHVALAYSQTLKGMLARARALIEEHLGAQLPELLKQAAAVHPEAHGRQDDDYATGVSRAVAEAARRLFAEFSNERMRATAATMGARAAEFQKAELQRNLGIDLVGSEPWLAPKIEAFAGQNASLIKSIPTRYFSEIEASTIEAFRSGTRAEDLADDLQDRYGVSESRAELIARDQIGKLNAQVNETRQRELGVEHFTWRTSKDERTCPVCAPLDGKVFSWDKPPAKGPPGEIHPRCRCTGEPMVDEVIDKLLAKPGAPPKPQVKRSPAAVPRPPKPPPAPKLPPRPEHTETHWETHYQGNGYGEEAAVSLAAARAAHEKSLDLSAFAVQREVTKILPPSMANRYRSWLSTLGLEFRKKATLREVIAEAKNALIKHELETIAAVHGHAKALKGKTTAPDLKEAKRYGMGPTEEARADRIIKETKEALAPLLSSVAAPGEVHLAFRPGRAYYSLASREVVMEGSAHDLFEGTLAHEVGHAIEHASPARAKAAAEFLLRRTNGGASLKKLKDLDPSKPYDPHEEALEDGFHAPYVGKLYLTGAGQLAQMNRAKIDPAHIMATEVTSMGMQWLLSPRASEFMKKDPEHFFFTLGQLGLR